MLEANATLERLWICEGWMVTRYIRYADPDNDWLPYNHNHNNNRTYNRDESSNNNKGSQYHYKDRGRGRIKDKDKEVSNCTSGLESELEYGIGKVVEACTGTVNLSMKEKDRDERRREKERERKDRNEFELKEERRRLTQQKKVEEEERARTFEKEQSRITTSPIKRYLYARDHSDPAWIDRGLISPSITGHLQQKSGIYRGETKIKKKEKRTTKPTRTQMRSQTVPCASLGEGVCKGRKRVLCRGGLGRCPLCGCY